MISEGLSPYFTRMIVNDLIKSSLPFSLHSYKTTTAQLKKQMDLTLRHWSPTHNEVWVTYYASLFFGHAESEKVAEKMYEHLVNNGIPVHRMASLIWDGPNVNKTILRKMNGLILQDCPEFPDLIDLGSCSIHVIHNAFGKGLEKHGKEVDKFRMDLHSLFKYSAARHEDSRTSSLKWNLNLSTFKSIQKSGGWLLVQLPKGSLRSGKP